MSPDLIRQRVARALYENKRIVEFSLPLMLHGKYSTNFTQNRIRSILQEFGMNLQVKLRHMLEIFTVCSISIALKLI